MLFKKKLAQFYGWFTSMALIVVLLLPGASAAKTSYLSLKDGKSLSRKEFNALKPKISQYFESAEDDLDFDNQTWVYYKGNLKVNGNFFNSSKGIIVEGNLIVEGLYYDEESALF